VAAVRDAIVPHRHDYHYLHQTTKENIDEGCKARKRICVAVRPGLQSSELLKDMHETFITY
jgi:hypothetical protein